MTTSHAVLSFLGNRPLEGLVDNHKGYAQQQGYAHYLVDATHVWGPRQPSLFRMHTMYQHLLKVAPGELLLVLDQFAVVYWPHPMHLVFDGIDSFVSAQSNNDALCTTSMVLLRNTAAVRDQLRCLIKRVADWAAMLGPDVDAPDTALVSEFFRPRPAKEALPNGITPNVQANWPGFSYHDQLIHVRPLIANGAPSWKKQEEQWRFEYDYDFRNLLNLVEEAAALAAGKPAPHVALATVTGPSSGELHLNEGAPIAFVSLYTANIASYGQIHEESFVRYCKRHGYGYHLYREVPAFANGLPGSWAKAHVMQRHMRDHEFLFWVDADVLAVNQAMRMEPLIEGREALVGTDHTAWAMKSGMVGVRNTDAMHALIDDIRERIENAEDRSTVHAKGGDQTYFWYAFESRGLVTQACVVDSLTLDASPIYATRDNHLVHFPAQENKHRAVTMNIWNRWSVEQDAGSQVVTLPQPV